jgi:ribose transport system permease protein
MLSRLFDEYGSVLVLLLLCAYYSYATLSEKNPITPAAGRQLAQTIAAEHGANASVVIVVRTTTQDRAFAEAIESELLELGATVLETVHASSARDASPNLERLAEEHPRIDAIATNNPCSIWGPLQESTLSEMSAERPALSETRVHKPQSYMWPSFLTRENLVNVVNQNADIAIIAIGMTLVIITAGIDLSVGSLVALSGVMTAVTLQKLAGADASVAAMIACSMLGIGLAAGVGGVSGSLTTFCRVPAFVVTLAMMMIARGLALRVAVDYQRSISGGTNQTPEAVSIEAAGFGELGNGTCFGIPNPIVLMLSLYVIAHLVMTRTSLGRYIYAVGGNPEAARLSGVPVRGVLVLVYALCGALSGLAGIVDASRFVGGRPSAGVLYELGVIAAVVVGGTSLAGGRGGVWGTVLGALIIGVLDNGLVLLDVSAFYQMVVKGLVILGAVALDRGGK